MKTKTRNLFFDILYKIRSHWAAQALCIAAGPVVSYCLVEYLNSNAPFRYFSFQQVVLNLIWYYMVFFLVYLIVGRAKLSVGISSTLFYIFGTANHYVYAFRGRTIFPGDFLTLRTAANVAGSYDYTPDKIQLLTLVILAGYLLLLAALPRQKGRKMPSIRMTVCILALCIAYTGVFFATGFVSALGIKPSMWTTRGNGFILNFTVSLRYSSQDPPAGYGEEELSALAREYPGEKADGEAPVNLIVVMNEAFSDLSVLGDFETNQDFMPYYRSLTENCKKGNAYASVFGGTTANSEYEFLTGNTTAFMAEGVVPFQMYITEHASSLPRQMKAQGYKTVAMHPYLPSGWNRIPVYEHFRFDEVLFKDDFQNKKFMRNYVTDRSNYENLIRIYEEKEPGEELFIFNVTMQNHSSYKVDYRGLPESVWLTGPLLGKYPGTDQYLSGMKESDEALRYLIEYFSEAEERTAILLFGDHQPQVEKDFFCEILGGKLEDLPQQLVQLRQITPFILWTNYELEEESGLELSMNYLAAWMLSELGMEMTGYQQFLLELSESLPVINTLGFKDARGRYYDSDEDMPPELSELIRRYRILQHCDVFDTRLRPEGFFLMPE